MNAGVGYAALIGVFTVTAVIGFYGLRISRTTEDFYVASRTVRPWWNASAIGGEYLSAASFLGVAGLILISGADALWFPIGYTAGYLMLLLFVAAPLRRSGAYTIPDFTEARLESPAARRITSLLVVLVGWFYIVPQLQGAALTIRIATGLPPWVGSVAVAVVVCVTVVTGGMRSITFVQAFQFWLKLTAIAVPIVFVLIVLANSGLAVPAVAEPFTSNPISTPPAGAYRNISLVIALLFGTLGLPHVLVRFYTNPDGPSARRTTLIVLGLLSVFYLFPTLYGVVGRAFAPDLAAGGTADALVLLLPGRLIPRAGRRRPHGPRHRRSLRRVPLDHLGAHRLRCGSDQPGRARRTSARLPYRGGVLIHRAARRRAADRFDGAGRKRGPGVRFHRLHHLPAAVARDLVAWLDGRRRHSRNAGGRRPVRRLHPAQQGAGARCRAARRSAGATGGLERAGGLRGDGGGFPGDQEPTAGRHHENHDPAAHAGAAAGCSEPVIGRPGDRATRRSGGRAVAALGAQLRRISDIGCTSRVNSLALACVRPESPQLGRTGPCGH